MKYLRLKANEIGEDTSTAALLRACLNDVPQGGMKLDEMRSRIRVLDAVEVCSAAPGPLALEDADAKTLQRVVGAMSWAKVSPQIIVFCDAVANMCASSEDAV